MRLRPSVSAAGAAVVAALSIVSCGGSSTSGSGANTVPANPDLTILAQDIKFDKKEYSVKAGAVKTAYISKGEQTHTLVVQDPRGNDVPPKLRVTPGQQHGAVYQLAAGTYVLYCDIPGHRDAGMQATLTVTP
jgi:uncharacterized cupredoxin-like copper-binding protein